MKIFRLLVLMLLTLAITLGTFTSCDVLEQYSDKLPEFVQNLINKETEEEKKEEEKKDEGAAEKDYEALAPQITFDDFLKPDLRVAKVIDCEVVPKSKKLLKLQLDLGFEKRQVLSGISKFYKPEDLIGKKVIMVANLAPRMMGGEESNGMVLATGETDVKVLFAADDAEIGDRVG